METGGCWLRRRDGERRGEGAIGREKEGESGRRISQSVLQHLPDMGQSKNDKDSTKKYIRTMALTREYPRNVQSSHSSLTMSHLHEPSPLN